MFTRVRQDLWAVSDTCKMAVIDNEFHMLNVDIATLQETRHLDSSH